MTLATQKATVERAINALRSSIIYPQTQAAAQRYALLALRHITDTSLALKIHDAWMYYNIQR